MRIGARPNRSMSILASDLVGTTNFDSKQTLPVMDMGSDKYDKGTSLYLQMLGVNEIDKIYNQAVRKFEIQLEEQEIEAKLQANVAGDVAANLSVEAQGNLGTGASAVAAVGRNVALDAAHADIEAGVAEAYQTGVQSMNESYIAELENLLGAYDPVTGTFAELSNFQTMSGKVSTATAKVIAKMIDPEADTLTDTGDKSYTKILMDAGYAVVNADGSYTLTDKGEEMVDMLFNGANADKAQEALGGATLVAALAEEMLNEDYNMRDGTVASLSDEKREQLLLEYQSWILENQMGLRLSAWDLYEEHDDGSFTIDTHYDMPDQSSSTDEGVLTEGISVLELARSDVSDCTEEEFTEMKKKLVSGEISNGYITFQAGRMYDNDKYYYVDNGVVYKTEYTAANPPPTITLESANVYSFGDAVNTGRGKNQDRWVNKVISAAKAGKIPDGSYINMNYGIDDDKRWYYYEDGVFKHVPANTKVTRRLTDVTSAQLSDSGYIEVSAVLDTYGFGNATGNIYKAEWFGDNTDW